MLVAAEVAIASHQLTFLATLLAVVLSIQVANVVLTTVADQSVARTQSPESVAKMALASDVVVVVQVSRQTAEAQGSFTVNGSKEGCTVLDKGKAATVSIGKFMNPVLFDMCR